MLCPTRSCEKLQAVVDGKPSGNVSERRKILQLANINSDAISYDELNKKNRDELREFFKEKEIIYITSKIAEFFAKRNGEN